MAVMRLGLLQCNERGRCPARVLAEAVTESSGHVTLPTSNPGIRCCLRSTITSKMRNASTPWRTSGSLRKSCASRTCLC